MSLFHFNRAHEDRPEARPADAGSTRARELTPPVDIYEGADELLLLADLPGVEPSGLSVSFDAPELRIEGRRGSGEMSSVYTRTFRVNESVDANGISAELNAGVLTLRLPKAAQSKPKKIEVRAG